VFISRELAAEDLFLRQLQARQIDAVGMSLICFEAVSFDRVPPSDWLFVYSKNAVYYFFKTIEEAGLGVGFSGRKWAVLGQATADFLFSAQGIKADFIGTGEPSGSARAFLELAKGQSVLFLQARQSKRSVERLLNSALPTESLVVYDNFPKHDFAVPYCDVLVFTSPMNAEAYCKKYNLGEGQKIVAIGASTAKSLEMLGHAPERILVATKPYEEDLARAVISVLEWH
jgi:hydroxymethylbilane synthase